VIEPPQRAASAPGDPAAISAPQRAPRRLSTLRKPVNIAFLLVVIALLTGWWVELRPTSFLGGPASVVIVRGTSMLPLLRTGDVVLAEAQSSYRVGDLVVYAVPKGQLGAGDDLIHRIVAGNPTTGYTLKGDNNPRPDPWTVPRSDILGREVLILPGAGQWLLAVRSPIFAGAVAAAVAVWLVLAPPAWTRRRKRVLAPSEGGVSSTEVPGDLS
jgi:signal peptidase